MDKSIGRIAGGIAFSSVASAILLFLWVSDWHERSLYQSWPKTLGTVIRYDGGAASPRQTVVFRIDDGHAIRELQGPTEVWDPRLVPPPARQYVIGERVSVAVEPGGTRIVLETNRSPGPYAFAGIFLLAGLAMVAFGLHGRQNGAHHV